MISETGKRESLPAGFSLLEVVLVLGIIAIAASMVITNFSSIASRGEQMTTEDTLRAAIRHTRSMAARHRKELTLSFDQQQGWLVVSDGRQFKLAAPFARQAADQISFYLVPPSTGLSSFLAPLQTMQPTQKVIFGSDGSSSHFVAEINTAVGTVRQYSYDPFSNLTRKIE